MTLVAGVDGTAKGWVAIELNEGRFLAAKFISSVTSAFSELEAAKVIAIDVPIGYGPRLADTAARAYLRGAGSTVFPTPPRELLERPFAPGLGISKQSHSLGPRILHVTELASRDQRIYEVHPEVSFRAMNLGVPLRYRKKSAGGAVERMRLLAVAGIDLDDLGDAAAAPLDDVLDAAAAAWSAHRIATGKARSLPDPPAETDGRKIAIWY